MCPGPFRSARLALAPAADNRRDRFQRRGLRPMAAYWPLDDRPGADAPVARPDRARLGAAERIRDAAARPGAVGGRADARRPGGRRPHLAVALPSGYRAAGAVADRPRDRRSEEHTSE